MPAMSSSPWAVISHPVAILAIQLCHTATVLGFTGPDSLLRLGTFPLQFLMVWLLFESRPLDNAGVVVSSLTAAVICAFPLHYLDLVLLSKWSFATGGPTKLFDSGGKTPTDAVSEKQRTVKAVGRPDTFWARLRFGLATAFSSRHLNTPYEVKGSPYFSSRDKDFVPSRGVFLLQTALILCVCCGIVDFLFASSNLTDLEGGSGPMSTRDIPFFSNLGSVTGEKLIMRFIISVVVWVQAFCFVQILNRTGSFVLVGLGISDVRDNRPMFGDFSELYNVRQFWGSFWHQMFRNSLNNPAWFVVHDVLGLPKKGLVQRYLKILIGFFISGVFHTLLDLDTGVSLREAGAIRFFCMQTLGIMIEDGVQELWRRLSETRANGKVSRSKGEEESQPALWKRVMGFLWFWVFMAWTIPGWIYPAVEVRTAKPEKEVAFPFSLAERYLEMGK